MASVLGLVAMGAGCGDDPAKAFPPGPHAAPTGAGDCDDLPAIHGDPGIVLGTDWSAGHHDYADRVVVQACVSTSLGGRVALVATGSGIRTRPRSVAVDPSGSGVIAFEVTVARGASGEVRVRHTTGGAEDDLSGPVVAPDGDGWHFVPHQR